MKKGLLLLPCLAVAMLCFAQTLQVSDTGTVTRERWRDSLLRMDIQQVSTAVLEEWGIPIVTMVTFNGTLTDSNRKDRNL